MQLFCDDSLDILKTIPDQSIDLIVTDPPYFQVVQDDWDNQWKSEIDFLDWCDQVLIEFKRVLKANGSLYWFAGPYMAAKLELLIGERFNVLNHIVWVKPTGRHKATHKESLRKYFPQTERIIFAEQKGANGKFDEQCVKLQQSLYAPVVDYLNNLRKQSGFTINQCIEICGTSTASHYFQKSQFHFPSEQHFARLMQAFCAEESHSKIKQDFDSIRAKYHQLKQQYQAARRAFSVTRHDPYTDVWTFDVVAYYKDKHPCQKPDDLLRHIIKTSSRPGFTVLDAFMGSGSTGMSCLELDCYFIGIEIGEKNFNQAKNNLMKKWMN